MRVNYFFSETFANLKRNLLMTIAAISTVAISLLLLGGVLILGLIVTNITYTWEAKVEVSAYLLDDITDGELQGLTADITAMPEVQDVDYVSKGAAYEEFKQLYRDQPELYESLPRDALPASLRVKLFDANDSEEIAARISGSPGVEEVKFGGEIIKRLLQVNSLLRTITFGMSLVLMVAAAALIANTIRLAIYARREEIGIMKLVGATNWFIRVPFILEGVFAAMVGAIASGAVILAVNGLVFSRMGEALPFLRAAFAFTNGELLSVMLSLIVVGMVVGIIGSSMALRRFLEV
jgi:cell division transport system permease protein